MANPTQANPTLGALLPLYDDSGHQLNVAARARNVQTDANGVTYGDVGIQIDVTRSTVTLFTTAQSAVGSGNSGDLNVNAYTELSIDITTTAQSGTNPTLQFFYERKGADGNYYALWQSNVLTAAANTISTSIGSGCAYNQSLGATGRLRWVVGGSATPTYTFTPNVFGK